ncbi:MAG TPA: asparagine synthase (glutamine-hydrolyzing) [Acidimicrobiia bacterium]|nr:asparagine synthase (glutamine-hydrolyzing) [Acidimicrobiia bacterium]
MCGIAGFWGAPDAALLATMTARIAHRGPDGEGFFEHPLASLGHRRLAIIDPVGGHQPVGTDDGLVQLTYNGEVYNFRELRAELEPLGHTFHTSCDTEVVLHAYLEWGTDCFARFNGMWALAILDLRDGHGDAGRAPRLVLARDHYGIKPLYYARSGSGRVLFASEAKAVLADPELETAPDRQWLYDYLLHGLHDHQPQTAFAGIRALAAATWAVVDADGVHEQTYWTPTLSSDAPADPAEFRARFERSVERRLVADVPAGTCLSGGIDSSSIVAMASRLLSEHVPDAVSLGDRLKTFSIVYDGDPIDEREYMDAVLAEVDAEPAFAEPTSERFVDELDRLVWHQDEPIVSTGPYAQWCVMRLAQPKVTVLLNGQGGDELLAGYVPYQYVYLRELLRRRRLGAFAREAWESRDVLKPLVKRRLADRRRALPIKPLLRPALYDGLEPPKFQRSQDDLKRRLVADLQTFSLPSLLRYEDRNSMAFSMESRLPFLDQELVDWVLQLPSSAIVDRGWSRAILRDGLRGVLTEKVRTRRWKVGFTTPETRWLRARRAAVQGLFRSPEFCARPYWDAVGLAAAFDRFCAGEVEPSQIFWRAINTEIWLRVFFDHEGRSRLGDAPGEHFTRVGDAWLAVRNERAAAALAQFTPHEQRHLFAQSTVDGRAYARAPVRTRLFASGDSLVDGLVDALGDVELVPGDVVAVSEKAVAISQGRSYPVGDVQARPLARTLSRFVGRSASGIGLGIPATMELAIREAGEARILGATAAAAVTKPFGVKGVFYRVAGPAVRAIDGPTRGTIPPYDGHAKMGPADPDGVARDLSARLGVGVAVIDANDIGVNVLGVSSGVDATLVASLLRDNPLGQGAQQTPVALLRPV